MADTMPAARTERPTSPSDPEPKLGPRTTWYRRHCSPEDRKRIMGELAITRQPGWTGRFAIMLTLSVVVAVMGLSADSAAVVIGAMLLAPLMQPVLAVAASLSMALFSKALRSATVVVIASAGAIAVSYLLALVFIRNGGTLPDEVVSRTKPDIRDLVVALGAGAAGSYATVRKDASAALPGVAVAVALVPPLGTVGIALEAGETSFARGALLLYTTNLAAIVFAGVVVFLVTGFVPPRRLASTSPRLALASLFVVAALTAIALPLYRASVEAVAATDQQLAVEEVVDRWLGTGYERRTVELGRLDEGRIVVVVESFEPPLDDGELRAEIQQQFGAEVTVLWDRIERARTTTTLAPTTTVLSDLEIRQGEITTLVQEWLEENDGRLNYELESVTWVDGAWRVEAAGVGPPPAFDQLQARLDEGLAVTDPFLFYWTERQAVDPSATTTTTPVQVVQEQLVALVSEWAAANEVTVLDVAHDGERTDLLLSGAVEPIVDDLVASIEDLTGPEADIAIEFVPRVRLTTTTTEAPDDASTTTTTGG